MKRLLFVMAIALGFSVPALAQSEAASIFGMPIPDSSVQVQAAVAGYGARFEAGVEDGYVVGHRLARGGNPQIVGMVTQVAMENGINPRLAHAIVRIESGYNCGARNGAAVGIMQTNRRTAASVGVYNPTSCRGGLEAGMRYLKQAIAMHGYGCAAFSAYQSGLGIHRCSAYGRRVMAMMNGGGIERASFDTYGSAHHRHHRYWRYAARWHHHYRRYAFN